MITLFHLHAPGSVESRFDSRVLELRFNAGQTSAALRLWSNWNDKVICVQELGSYSLFTDEWLLS
jgi:hypothetical protein